MRSGIGIAMTVVLLATLPAAAEDDPPRRTEAGAAGEGDVYFHDWEFRWGTDTTLTAASHDGPATTEVNDHASPFSPLNLRLYGRLTWDERAELVVDLYSSDAGNPRVYGLYARIQPSPYLGVRVGLIPLVVGSWQSRAYPDRQPLIGAPLHMQYLVAVRNDSVPAGVDELLSRRGAQRATHFTVGPDGTGHVLTSAYEPCWDTGVELFGAAGALGYRVALMQGTPGSAVIRDDNSSKSLEGRLTYRFGDAAKVGVSYSRGAYLKRELEPFLPAGREIADYRQDLVGADLQVRLGPVEFDAEWMRSDFGTPFVAERLRNDGFSGEIGVEAIDGLRFAARYSSMLFGDVRTSTGRLVAWEADAGRWEAGVAYRFWGDHFIVKGAFQQTRVDLDPARTEKIFAAQLAVHY